nr:immunoglobulin heavy chain junction region [Macaca mulatta]MOX04015.1 immunoglobulin heavy chain junction region [Macaca mulatta]MOX05882.1 immunoglobulin heavy chain junction region [Macaca mulatta]
CARYCTSAICSTASRFDVW